MPKSLKTALQSIVDQLKTVLPQNDQCWFEAELLLGEVLKRDRAWIATRPEIQISDEQETLLQTLCARRVQHEPLAYILQRTPFFSHLFFVNAHVLIPRPESEWLVQRALRLITPEHQTDWLVWDAGTGSGCLSLSIAQARPDAHVLASDISVDALIVAQKNARLLTVKNIEFFQGSLLSQSVRLALQQKTDKRWLIVANLPYLPLSDRSDMQTQVVKFEPSLALFAEDEGLALIKELLQQLKGFLQGRHHDVILLEHDPRQAIALAAYCREQFPESHVSTEKDQNGTDRFTVLQG